MSIFIESISGIISIEKSPDLLLSPIKEGSVVVLKTAKSDVVGTVKSVNGDSFSVIISNCGADEWLADGDIVNVARSAIHSASSS